MNTLKTVTYFLLFCFITSCSKNSVTATTTTAPESSIYFPPINTNTWDTVSITDLNWNENQLQPLLDFLEDKNTKGFIVLYNGKMVIENYFNTHDASANWYWASAGKTLTTAVSGIAQDEGIINLNNTVSTYLGEGWTSATLEQENLITGKHLLSMNSGLDDSLGDAVTPENLNYIADAGDRWAYHNVYVKMQEVVSLSSDLTWTSYFNSRLRDRIGMSGSWVPIGDLKVYWSNTRSMARFGLLMSAHGIWNSTEIVSSSFLNEATSTSQNINEAYGYLWWLNGKNSYHLPQSQFEFNGELIPNAPSDMYAALGKNDQKIYIVPSKKLVIVRMGEAADDSNFALSTFDNELWEKLNFLID
jgi:CubicO group peptidase (beta-lactamase class C family)